MINMPKDYDNIPINNFSSIEEGGHYGRIMMVKEMLSKSNLQMIIVYFDTTEEDKQPNFYQKKYEADKANPAKEEKWAGTIYLVIDEHTDYGPRNLKNFVTAVEASNPGFQVTWGQGFCECLAGKKIGFVCRTEEFIAGDGQLMATVKPYRFCEYSKAYEQKNPRRKCVATTTTPASSAPPVGQMSFTAPASNPAAAADGFVSTPFDPVNDEGLPFG